MKSSFFTQFRFFIFNEEDLNLALYYSNELKNFYNFYINLAREKGIQPAINISLYKDYIIQNRKPMSINEINLNKPCKMKFTVSIQDDIYRDVYFVYKVYKTPSIIFRTVDIHSYFINILHRYKGYGKLLLEKIDEYLKPAVIEIDSPLRDSIPFYLKQGFDIQFYSDLTKSIIKNYKENKDREYNAVIVHIIDDLIKEYLQEDTLLSIPPQEYEKMPSNVKDSIRKLIKINFYELYK